MEAADPESEISNDKICEYDADLEREFEEDIANTTTVRMKLWEAQALDSSVGVEEDTCETALLFEEALHERDQMVSETMYFKHIVHNL